MSHLETISKTAYTNWQVRCNPGDCEWEGLSQERKNAWLAIVLAVIEAVRSTGVL